jgi:hypothetical protein
MRILLALPALALLSACGVDNDPANNRVTVTYDKEKIERSAEKAGQAAKTAAHSAANVAGATADAVKREVGDIDVDVRVTRDKKGEPTPVPSAN